MSRNDFASDIVGAGNGSLPESTLAEITLVDETDRGIFCHASSIPIEISKGYARQEFYREGDPICQECLRCASPATGGRGCQRRLPGEKIHCAAAGALETVAVARSDYHFRAGDFTGDLAVDHPAYLPPVRPENAGHCSSCGNCED